MTPPQRTRRGAKHPGGAPERLYVVAGGAEETQRAPVDLVTLIVALAPPAPTTPPEQAAVLGLCGSPLSVAEISAYLSLPFSAVTVLLTDLLTAGLIQAHEPVVRSALPDRSLLEAVMHGLQKL
ncbi:DUF742 domain-containing protein [Streptomyces sp. NPDC050560]|uniref:DUF742 domain-containing protein n=1 Tax=Streptomyces sp. NPDC050560 TaxID=3365630 RepID=UPI0037889C4E